MKSSLSLYLQSETKFIPTSSPDHMISLTYNTTFVLFIFFSSSFACSALTSCGPFNGFNSTFFLCDGDTITSIGEIKFQLGFFTPRGNLKKSRYVGIWYVSDPEIVVWVANRDHPLPENSIGSFGVLNDGDGNLQLLDEKGNSYFSTALELSQSFNSRTVRLFEGGNLVLSDEMSGKVLWQSFDHPTDTFLPGMKMSEKLKLTSWMSNEDPSPGNYRFEQGEEGAVISGYVVMNGTNKYWKSGGQSRNFATSNKMYDLANYLLDNYNPVNKRPRSNFPVPLNPDFNKTRLLMSWSGEIQYFRLNSSNKNWVKIWSEPQTWCSVYNACGKFGTCRLSDRGVLCECLQGFKSEVPESWDSGDYSGGCTRNSSLCVKEANYTFLSLTVIKVEDADYHYEAKDEDTCKEQCLNNCHCQAYSYYKFASRRDVSGSGSSGYECYIWNSELVDIQIGNATNERNISVKVANSTSGASVQNQSLSQKVVIILITCSVIAVLLLTCSLYYIYYRRKMAKRKGCRRNLPPRLAHIQGNTVIGSHPRQFSEEDKESIDVPFFDLESILAATDSFSDANKLGEGGFGPVYKGTFPGGQEIAVKRLSVHSMQGLEELKNEVVLIAKLQHRNLVRLLGYCIEGDENILLYEYMPNKSLDAFIFDQTLCMLLNWEKRFEIILGIARGLLYLHQDSRLRVIHRDLKASNILLDEDMNPKISDFGLARIVGGRETQANTNRVVGTYGYMSPEYALEGLFSIKSDVFSFGVVLLEIISGKKNTGFYKSQQDLNLLGYAWRLWKEDNPLNIMDQTIVESCNKNEVLNCIIIGLLCVQEDPSDRPNMSNIVRMLGSSDIENLPSPKQPAFVARTNQQIMSNNESTLSHQQIQSNNEITLSVVKPR